MKQFNVNTEKVSQENLYSGFKPKIAKQQKLFWARNQLVYLAYQLLKLQTYLLDESLPICDSRTNHFLFIHHGTKTNSDISAHQKFEWSCLSIDLLITAGFESSEEQIAEPK